MLGRKYNIMKLPSWADVLQMKPTELNGAEKGWVKITCSVKGGIKVSFAQKKPNSRSRKYWGR
jgi:hypothetical protein